MTRPTHEIDAYLDGEPTPDQARALQAWIQADQANAKAFLAAIRLHQQIGTQLRKDRFDQALRTPRKPATTKDGDAAIQALAEIASLDAGIPQSPVNFATWREEQAEKAAAAQRKIWQTRTLIGSAVAAALLLTAALLTIVFTSDTPNTPIVDNSQPKPAESAPPIFRDQAVATITATHNAVWATPKPAGDLRRGSALHPNDRLTLTAGFAEITTEEGAVVILEAPATVELLDDDNAIRLHTGKLVGICETKSSKGFLVRTPHMDVTDLGTRFGVDASQPEATEVHVYEGEVEVTRPYMDRLGQRLVQRLIQGQAVKAEATDDGFVLIDPALDRFAQGLGEEILPGTGHGVEQRGGVDPNWSIIQINGQRLDKPVQLTRGKPIGASQATPNKPGEALWLKLEDTEQFQGDQEAVYTIQTIVTLPKGIDLDRAVLKVDFHADDQLVAMGFNARPYPASRLFEQDASGKGTASIPLREVLIRGDVNAINFEVSNAPSTNLYLYVAWRIEYPERDPGTN